METENAINKSILATTVDIQDNFPELLSFLLEMPITVPINSAIVITTESLSNYNSSLKMLLT